MNGEWSEERCFEEFLKTFESTGEIDGKVGLYLNAAF